MRDFKNSRKSRAKKGLRRKTKKAFNLKSIVGRAMRWTAFAILLVVGAAAVQAGYLFFTGNPCFSVARITVEGNHKVSRDEIVEAANIEGANIFSFNIKDVGWQIESIPWIRKVAVERRLPGEVKIVVQERVPIALINLERLYYIDEKSYIYAEADKETGWDFPVLAGIDRKKLLGGDRSVFNMVDSGIGLLKEIDNRRGTLSSSTISELVFDERGGITIYKVGDGIPLYLGGGSRFGDRIDRVEKVLADLKMKGIRPGRIEAAFDDRVLVRLRS